MGHFLDRVRTAGALPWLGLAWLAGPLPGADARGVTGQPTGELWWWHVAAGVLLVVVVVDAVRAGEVATRIDAGAARAWRPGRRWHTVVVVALLALAVLAAAQVGAGTAGWGHVVSFVAGAVVVGLAPARVAGGAAVGHLARGTVVLAVVGIGAALLSWEALAETHGFYALKQQVRAPVAAHNVLAAFLLAGAPAVVLASVRRPRRWWPLLAVTGVGLAATLSRGAVVAGLGAVVVAWALRDRTVARRLALVVAIAAVGIGVVLGAYGAPVPHEGGPSSVVARSELWGAGFDAATAQPVTGVGLDGFLAFTDRVGLAAPHEHAHDLVLHAAAVLGVPGLVAVVALWLGVLAGAARLLDRDRRIVVLVGLAGLGAMAMVDEVALRPATTGLLALLAVAVAAGTEARRPG